jgi:uncharacterized protein YbjT (DUF2867 family)
MQRLLLASLVAAAAAAAPRRVAVTGAGGQTGQIAFRRMLARRDEFDPIGIVRNAQRRDELVEKGVPADNVRIADVTDPAAILEALEGCEALLIGSSAKVATLEFDTGVIDPATGRPKLGFPKGQPYEVDWLGQKHQIDAAQKCGCTHVVICSSMGGTDPDHMLNGLGREESDPPSKGNILQWKRKAERYLIESGLTYTIIHPGGLVDKPGGCRELVVGVDDVMVDGEGTNTIPRDDVAETMVQALRHPAFRNRSFDLRSKLEGDGDPTSDFARLLAPLGGRDCDYALGRIPDD